MVFSEKDNVLFSVYIDGQPSDQQSIFNEIEILAGEKMNDILNAEYVAHNCWWIVEDFKARRLKSNE